MYADITLGLSEEGEVNSPEIIASGGLGPCIAIGIYDKKRKCGYMIHEANADHHDSVPNFLEKVLKKSKRENLNIFVIGGGLGLDEDENDENVNDSIITARKFVENELEKRFEKNQLTIKWNSKMDTTELILDTSNGEFTVNRRDELNDSFDNDY